MKTSLLALLFVLGLPVFACDINDTPATTESAKTAKAADTTRTKEKTPPPPTKKSPPPEPAAPKTERPAPPAHLFM